MAPQSSGQKKSRSRDDTSPTTVKFSQYSCRLRAPALLPSGLPAEITLQSADFEVAPKVGFDPLRRGDGS